MAAKRNKSQARRNSGGGGGGGLSAGVWMLIGLALGIALFLFVPKYLGGKSADSFFRPKPNADAQPPAIDATSDRTPIAQNGDATAPGGKPKDKEYDFYTLLPGEETELSDKELAERARAEEAQRQADAQRAGDAAASPDAATPVDARPTDARPTDTRPVDARSADTRPVDAALPKPVDAGKSARAGNADAKPVASTKTAGDDNARYILQAGAFQASGDAEALKAKIAFLGLSARVESAQIGGNTVYRVRMGPYGSATELAEAKRKLAGGGLPAVAVKAK